MKKIMFVAVALVGMCLAACGGQTDKETSFDSTAVDTLDTLDSVVEDTLVLDTTVVDSLVNGEC